MNLSSVLCKTPKGLEEISTRANRNPVKKRRDEQQARAIARLLRSYLVHLSFTSDELRYLPKDVIDSAATAFAAGQER